MPDLDLWIMMLDPVTDLCSVYSPFISSNILGLYRTSAAVRASDFAAVKVGAEIHIEMSIIYTVFVLTSAPTLIVVSSPNVIIDSAEHVSF